MLFSFATFIFEFGGLPFLKGLFDEIKNRQLVMMTLIGLAISLVVAVTTTLFAEVLPKDKAEKIREVQSRGLTVTMTGYNSFAIPWLRVQPPVSV